MFKFLKQIWMDKTDPRERQCTYQFALHATNTYRHIISAHVWMHAKNSFDTSAVYHLQKVLTFPLSTIPPFSWKNTKISGKRPQLFLI